MSSHSGFMKTIWKLFVPALTFAIFLQGWRNCDLSARAAGDYEVLEADPEGNIVDNETVVAEQDGKMPEFTIDTVKNDAGFTVRDENGSYYFAESLAVAFTITEAESQAEETASPIIIKRNGTVLKEEAALTSFTDTLDTDGTYIYTIEDKAGNQANTSITVTAVKSTEEPKLVISWPDTAATVDSDTYFRTTPDILGNIQDAAGIAKIEYKSEGGAYQELIDYNVNTGAFLMGENTSYSGSLKQGSLTDELDLAEDGAYIYTFRVTNVLGNTAEAEAAFKLDTTPADKQVFIAYETDNTNPEQQKDTGILEFLQSTVQQVFGNETVTFHLYVKDGVPQTQDVNAMSGIDTQDLINQIQASDGKLELKGVQAEEESTASFTYQGTEYRGYTHITGEMVLPEGQAETMAADQLKINQLKDRAGNIRTQIDAADITGTTVVYIDNVAPVLEIDYGDGLSDEAGQCIYYQSDAQIQLKLKEAYYEMQLDENQLPVQPVITITGSNQANVNAAGWTALSLDSGYQAGTSIKLPAPETYGETEYVLTVQYQDVSGNVLEADETCKGSVSGDLFTNYKIVVDNKAPELTAYSILETPERQSGGLDVYKNNRADGDITVSFTIDDSEVYWSPEKVSLKIVNETDNSTVIEIPGNASEIDWSESSGSLHTGKYVFAGEAEKAAIYHAEISYADNAGNPLELGSGIGTISGKLENGAYMGTAFILDHKAPVFNISYTDAYRLVEETAYEPESDKTGSPVKGYVAFYHDDIKVEFTVQEDYVKFENGTDIAAGLSDFTAALYKDSAPISIPEIFWKDNGDRTYTGTFYIEKEDNHASDGTYQIKISYQDCAANFMVSDTDRTKELINDEGIYESPILVLDTQAPEITVSYKKPDNSEPAIKNTYQGRNYYGESIKLVLTVKEENGRYKELKDTLRQFTAADIYGTAVASNLETSVNGIAENSRTAAAGTSWEFDLSTAANYEIPFSYEDLAGNRVTYRSEKITVDPAGSGAPEFELSYAVSDAGFIDAVNYKNFGYIFADKKLTITVKAKDVTAGIRTIRYTVTDENGKVTKLGPKTWFAPSQSAAAAGIVYETAIPLETGDFNGTVLAEVYDWSDNTVSQSRGHVVESDTRHNSTGSAVITTQTSPSRTVNGTDYYNTDVQFNLSIKDTYSGLSSLSYIYGSSGQGSENYREMAGTDLNADAAQERVFEFSRSFTLAASENNRNQAAVNAQYKDNAGHSGSVEQFYNIDITAPRVEVTYDLNTPSNEKYYNQTRTATVTIWERNFSENDVDFRITNTDGTMPSISGWSHSPDEGDDTKHTCTVTFSADGDYTFTLSFMDLAGNKADYNRVDQFTIDKTKPVMTVTYDNNQYLNEYYYAQSRTAAIDIEEHNFDASLIDITITAQNGTASLPAVSAWRKNGDHNIATVAFLEDAEYTFDIAGKDLAGNEPDDYPMDHFVIDQTAPELEILNIEDKSANKGEVRPGIRYSDVNYDLNSTVIRMNGAHNGLQEMNGTTAKNADGAEILLDDFEHIPEKDDIYTMEAAVYDLAGNFSQASVLFSVNRFGSVYTFDAATEKLAGESGTYYTNKEQDIIVTETNVDTLEFREITCNFNGNLRTMAEGEDYTVEETGSEMSWKQYTYRIYKANFEEEGTYLLTIYSEDRAENTSDNNSKGKKVEFAIDKTSPTILLSGIEDRGQYRENSREATLDVQDNIRLSEVRVQIDGNEQIYDVADIAEAEGKLTFRAEGANHWQTLKITACDAAGNETSLKEMQFLVTSNIFVQFFMNKVLFYSVSGILVLAAGGVWWFVTAGKRRKKAEEE